MSDTVIVAKGDNLAETATLLLAAAAELGLDPGVVRTNTEHADSGFEVPAEVAKKAKLDAFDPFAELTKAVDEATAGSAEPQVDEFDQPVTTATPDHDAAAAAVGNIDPGPTPDEAQAALHEAGDSPTPPDKAPAKKAAAKRPARKRTTKKAAAKKAPAKKEG